MDIMVRTNSNQNSKVSEDVFRRRPGLLLGPHLCGAVPLTQCSRSVTHYHLWPHSLVIPDPTSLLKLLFPILISWGVFPASEESASSSD